MRANVARPATRAGQLAIVSQKTSDQTLSVAVKTTVHSANFTPLSTSAAIDGSVNGSFANSVAGTLFVEVYLSGVLVSGSARAFSHHGHTANPLNGMHVHTYPTNLTPGTTYEARISITPTGGTLNVRSLTNPTTEQAQIAVLAL